MNAVRPSLDVSDDSFLRLAPGGIAPLLARTDFLRRALPSLSLTRPEDRGEEGRRWRARAGRLGRRWDGTAEVWLERWHDGTLVHLYVRLEPRRAHGTRSRSARRLEDRLRRRWKRAVRGLPEDPAGTAGTGRGRGPGGPAAAGGTDEGRGRRA